MDALLNKALNGIRGEVEIGDDVPIKRSVNASSADKDKDRVTKKTKKEEEKKEDDKENDEPKEGDENNNNQKWGWAPGGNYPNNGNGYYNRGNYGGRGGYNGYNNYNCIFIHCNF